MFLSLVILAGVLSLIAWTIYYIIDGKSKYWTSRGVTLVKTTNLIKKFLILRDFTFTHSDVNIYTQLKGKRFGGYMELWNPVLVITDLDLMKQIYVKDFDHFPDRRIIDIKSKDDHMNLTMPLQRGQAWKDLRTKISPTFTTGRIRRMYDIFDRSAKKMVTHIQRESRKDDQIELRPILQNLCLDVIASAAFGLESNIYEDPNSLFVKMGKDLMNSFGPKMIYKFFLLSMTPKLCEILNITFVDKHIDRFLSKLVIDSIKHRETTNEKRDDFLQLMIEARQGKLEAEDDSQLDSYEKDAMITNVSEESKLVFDDDIIIAQSLLFFLAGFDGLEAVLSFALHAVAINPDIQKRLYQEIKAAVDDNNRELSYDIINSLEYLDMVLSETLRKYPIAVRIERKCNKSYHIPDSNLTIEKDIFVVIPSYAIHHDPDLWPEPEKFDPMRFTKENIANRHPMAYQPFGHGPRNCIGNRFALSEMKTAIAHLVLNFTMEPCQKTVIPMKLANQGALKPGDDVCLRIIPRN